MHLWRHWRHGWVVLVRFLYFWLLTSIVCIPALLLKELLAHGEAQLFNQDGFQWRPAVALLALLILLPIGLSFAARATGYFGGEATSDNQRRLQTVTGESGGAWHQKSG